jgi:hypothetical protein
MRSSPLVAIIVSLFLVPISRANAQTPEIQAKLSFKLWFRRLLQGPEVGGVPLLLIFLAMIAVAVSLASIWLVKRRGHLAADEDRG